MHAFESHMQAVRVALVNCSNKFLDQPNVHVQAGTFGNRCFIGHASVDLISLYILEFHNRLQVCSGQCSTAHTYSDLVGNAEKSAMTWLTKPARFCPKEMLPK